MKKFTKDRSSPSHLLSRLQKSAPNTPENQHSPRFYSPNNSAGKPRMNEIEPLRSWRTVIFFSHSDLG
uniref:Uncharacterized protein n=1 Tax=Panagrolaimus sp. ES5 TaxID=591445 RepID=A0AC34G2N1_9BILA